MSAPLEVISVRSSPSYVFDGASDGGGGGGSTMTRGKGGGAAALVKKFAGKQPVTGAALCSVVPRATPAVKRFVRSAWRLDTLEVKRLVICGMMTHMCIDATTRAAFDLGYSCLLAGDACATRDLSFAGSLVPAAHVQYAFLAALHGTYAQVVDVDAVLGELGE